MSYLNRVGVVGMTLIATSASAGVNFTSRTSAVRASMGYMGIYSPEIGMYYDSAAFNTLGTFDVTLPHGYKHTSTVTNSGVSGSFSGNKHEGASDGIATVKESSLVADFTVTGSVQASIFLNGGMSEAFYTPSKPELTNAYFVIYNVATNTVVFNSWDYAVFSYDPQSFHSTRTWSNVNQAVVLGAGNYRLFAGAMGEQLYYTGFGQGSAGGGSFTAAMTFADVPAPGGCAVLLGAALVAARRRRVV